MIDKKIQKEEKDYIVGYVLVPECVCLRCGARWISRKKEPPLRCAECGSPYWNKPIKNKRKEQ